MRRLLRLRHVVDVVPALSAVAEVAASRTDLESFILRLTLQVCIGLWLAHFSLPDYFREEGCPYWQIDMLGEGRYYYKLYTWYRLLRQYSPS